MKNITSKPTGMAFCARPILSYCKSITGNKAACCLLNNNPNFNPTHFHLVLSCKTWFDFNTVFGVYYGHKIFNPPQLIFDNSNPGYLLILLLTVMFIFGIVYQMKLFLFSNYRHSNLMPPA